MLHRYSLPEQRTVGYGAALYYVLVQLILTGSVGYDTSKLYRDTDTF